MYQYEFEFIAIQTPHCTVICLASCSGHLHASTIVLVMSSVMLVQYLRYNFQHENFNSGNLWVALLIHLS